MKSRSYTHLHDLYVFKDMSRRLLTNRVKVLNQWEFDHVKWSIPGKTFVIKFGTYTLVDKLHYNHEKKKYDYTKLTESGLYRQAILLKNPLFPFI